MPILQKHKSVWTYRWGTQGLGRASASEISSSLSFIHFLKIPALELEMLGNQKPVYSLFFTKIWSIVLYSGTKVLNFQEPTAFYPWGKGKG